MIPTRFKSKLPKTLSYPLGAEAISEALADAPHAGEMSLSFLVHAGWRASKFHRLIREGLPYRILTAAYMPPLKPGRSAPNSMVESGWYEGHWSITVYSVPRELRHAAGQIIREQGFPAVVAWLRSSSQIGWEARRHQIDLVFNPTDGALSVIREDGV